MRSMQMKTRLGSMLTAVASLFLASTATVCPVAAILLLATGANGALVANWRLDESSGNAICDTNATYNGTLTGSPTQGAAGKIGTAYTFNGSNYVTPGGPPTIVSSTLTISAWVYPTASNWGNIVYWSAPGGLSGKDIQFGMNNGVGMRYRQDENPPGSDSGSFSSSSGNTVPLNTWTHVVFVRNGTACTIYANGVSIASGTVPVPTTTPNAMQIGFGAGHYLIGSIDDVAIWNTALSVAKVQTLSSVLAVNSGTLDDYSVRHMDKLFTAYDTATSQSVTTPKGTLIWEKFSGSSGTAGQVTYTDGVYKAWFTDTEGVKVVRSGTLISFF
jgi:hypothetical protein